MGSIFRLIGAGVEGVHLTRTQESKRNSRVPLYWISIQILRSFRQTALAEWGARKIVAFVLYEPGSLSGGIFWGSLVIVTFRMLNILPIIKG